MSKNKILYITSTLEKGGLTNQLFGLISEVNPKLFEVKVLTLSPHPDNSRHKDFKNMGIKIASLNLSRILFPLFGKKEVMNEIRAYEPDIIHTHGIRANSVVSELNINNHCMTIHNATEAYINQFGKIIGNMMANKTIKNMKKTDYVICCSKTLKRNYSSQGLEGLYSIQNGIDVDEFSPPKNKNEKRKFRTKLNIDHNENVIIVVGSLVKGKDPVTIITAFKKYKMKNSRLILLGDGPLKKKCSNLIENDSNIEIRGDVNNVNEYEKAADIYVSASHSEGLPMSVMEAGSAGLNMVLSNIEQHKEIFEKSDIDIPFFNINDVERLASIFKEIDTKKPSTNYELSNYIRKNFNNKKMALEYEDLYFEMIESK